MKLIFEIFHTQKFLAMRYNQQDTVARVNLAIFNIMMMMMPWYFFIPYTYV